MTTNTKEFRRRILEELDGSGDFVSGQRLSDSLGISRAAVSKHVRVLRTAGYEIESLPRRGHRLIADLDTPLDIEVSRRLKTKRIGKAYRFLPALLSTNSFLADLPLPDCQDGMVVAADSQTEGRGRMQRTWHSPPGTNLYFSVLLHPEKPPGDIPPLALLTALSIVRALHKVVPKVEAGIKWPNDILVNGRKLAGVLCEMEAEADIVHKVILGVGINVNAARKDFPSSLRSRATSLSIEAGQPIQRALLMAELLNGLDEDYDRWLSQGLEAFLPQLQQHLVMLGKPVEVNRLGNKIKGVIQGLSADGALILKSGKKQHRVYSGELTL